MTFFKNLIQSFMFGQTAIAEHQLIHFDAGLIKYEGLTQILLNFLKIQKKDRPYENRKSIF